ncbi:MAG: choice-of-anchor Q domain-containing protein, partial [Planctomycetota bacterium]
GVWVEGDYHLLPGSPCIDAGDNNSVPADTTDLDGDGNTTEPIPWDLDGNPRVVDGDNDGNSVVDMGAYEANYVQVQMKFTPQAVNPGSQGKWFKLHFVLPEGFGVEDVDVNEPALCRLMDTDGVAESVDMNIFINEEDLVEVEVAFDRGAFSLCSSGQAERNAGVLGLLAGTGGQYFYGTDSIKIINKTWEHLAGFASHWLQTDCGPPDWCGGFDLDQDGKVNFRDFALFDACCIEIITE